MDISDISHILNFQVNTETFSDVKKYFIYPRRKMQRVRSLGLDQYYQALNYINRLEKQ